MIPTPVFSDVLAANHHLWLSTPKRDGADKKDGSRRVLWLNDRPSGTPGQGYGRLASARKLQWMRNTASSEPIKHMDDTTLMRIAILPPDERMIAIEDLIEVLVRGELTQGGVDQLERQVHQVNATLASWRRPH